jgi:DNA repair protein SbcC/Rad50
MIPLQLTLKNFLSYREASVDFSGLHTACICGANGAGKSSLLEAITWSIWGKSRAASEEDAISNGAIDMRVDFTFQLHGDIYRVIRSRQRSGPGTLELQVMADRDFKSLTQKGIKETQKLIDQYLKIDYDTFTNSAYLRQGKADEFMMKKPSERKQILADLLKLDQYEVLSDQAKKVAAAYKAQVTAIEQQCERDLERITAIPTLTTAMATAQEQIDLLQTAENTDRQLLETLKTTAQQRTTYQQQIQWSEQRQQELLIDLEQIRQDVARSQVAADALAKLLDRGTEIQIAYSQYQALASAASIWEDKAHQHQQLQSQLQTQEIHIERSDRQTQIALAKLENELTTTQQRQQELQEQLAMSPDVDRNLVLLQEHRQHLHQLDDLYQQSSGLSKRRQEIQSHIDKMTAQEQARLEQTNNNIQQIEQQLTAREQLAMQLQSIEDKITLLDNRRNYQERVQDKGQESKSRLAGLQAQRQGYVFRQQELAKKLETLSADEDCPLCQHPLSGEHWEHFLASNTADQTALREQIDDCQAAEIVTNRELAELRQEFKDIKAELAGYEQLREEKGRISSTLAALLNAADRLAQLQTEQTNLLESIERRHYAVDFISELQELDEMLAELGYDDKNRALAQSAVDRYRWAEIKHGDLQKAGVKLEQLLQQQVQIEQQLQFDRQAAITTTQQLQQALQQIQSQITAVGYDSEQQRLVQASLRATEDCRLQYQQWQQAITEHPQIVARLMELQTTHRQKLLSQQQVIADCAGIREQLAALPDGSQKIQELEQQVAERRQQIDRQLSDLGQITEKLQQLQQIQDNLSDERQKLAAAKQQQLVYDELTKAFGKNGIQALIVENVLPQVEVEANYILSRLSNNQFHIQFITQKHTKKATKSKKESLKNAKLIDTLEISIGDANGTRPYENYSGGEAFRINFSIRLALAKLLSQRAGTPLQMLVIDEGFGTQDREGCDRLIAAINAISNDFACVLAVTHMPQFKEAFQTRIEVSKTASGSQIQIIS